MVWGLFPVDPLPGEHEYYIFRKGTYKVGRKGCDIIINKDKGVSRVHAEIIVDEMICVDHSPKRHSNNSSKVRIRDCSKYGTFINNDLGSKEKVHEYPNKETMLKDGEMVAFGTGNAKYRFSYVPLVLFASSSKPSVKNQLQEKMLMIGANVDRTWSSKCTHMVIDDSISINDEIIDAIVARKPVVRFSWIELISGKTICTEVPSTLSHAPTLLFEGVSFKVTDPQSREQCLKGYTFLLESVHKYKFKEKLQLLLDVGGAKVVCVETSEPCSQNLGDNQVCVVPSGLTSCCGSLKKYISLPKLNEMELVTSVISGQLDPSIMKSAPVVITSSCSTDETVVADSDEEMETATSVRAPVVVNLTESVEDEYEEKIAVHEAEPSRSFQTQNIVHVVDSHDSEQNIASPRKISKPDDPYHTDVKSESVNISSSKDRYHNISSQRKNEHGSQGFFAPNQETSKPASVKSDSVNISLSKDKDRMSESENLDIIYSQNLIVRELNTTQSGQSSRNGAAMDFKRFRKTSAPSGNSFNNLIPFAKHAYEASDYGNEYVSASIKEEKKRKQMEAISEDLFNNEKKSKRGASGTLRGLFARG